MNPFDSFHVGLIFLFMSQGKYIYARAHLSVCTSSARQSVVHSIFTFEGGRNLKNLQINLFSCSNSTSSTFIFMAEPCNYGNETQEIKFYVPVLR